jgi:hypothetical protein
MTKITESRAGVVEQTIEMITEKMDSKMVKPTLADLVRMLQIDRDLQPDTPREVRVTWVEPYETTSASKV